MKKILLLTSLLFCFTGFARNVFALSNTGKGNATHSITTESNKYSSIQPLFPSTGLSSSYDQTVISKVRGVLTVAGSDKPIQFAHIGVPGKNLGTISRLDGSYEVDLSTAAPDDSLVFSAIGYKRAAFPITELTERFDVSLSEDIAILNEVVVTAKREQAKLENLGRIKPSKITRGQNGLGTFGFGGEQGIRINTQKQYYLEEVSFHLRFNTVDSILFRINVYDIDENGLPKNSLLNKDLFVKSKKKQKWINKKLGDDGLVIDQDIIVSYELVQIWYSDKSSNDIFYTYGKDYPEGGMYFRRSSMDRWITSGQGAFPITLYISGREY